MTTYSPEQIAGWTQSDWDALAGRTIALSLHGEVWERGRGVRAVRLAGPVVVISWEPEGSLTFSREGVEITVHA